MDLEWKVPHLSLCSSNIAVSKNETVNSKPLQFQERDSEVFVVSHLSVEAAGKRGRGSGGVVVSGSFTCFMSRSTLIWCMF